MVFMWLESQQRGKSHGPRRRRIAEGLVLRTGLAGLAVGSRTETVHA
jgi:hypothetical protein